MKGFLLIDKGKGLTSFDVIRKMRKWLHEKKIGHAGTLDPLATGLLIVAVGEATKFLEYLIGCDKEYIVKARFGAVSETFDAEGPVTFLAENEFKKFDNTSEESLRELIEDDFIGEIDQVPPKYSALKIAGKKAADLMRQGKEVEMKSRKVKIYHNDIISFEWPQVSLKVGCGSGTYIRSLVYDIGEKLGCGAYVLELRRTRIDSQSVDGNNVLLVGQDFDSASKKVEQFLISPEEFFKTTNFIEITDQELVDLANGKTISSNNLVREGLVLAKNSSKIVGIIENAPANVGLKFRKLIH